MHGVAFRLPPGEEELELQLVWRREMFSDSYVPRWVTIDIQGRAVEAVTFVVDRDKSRYAGHLSESEIVSAISSAQGILGTGVDYLAQTIDSLDKLGLHDGDLERIWNLVKMASVR
jgi:glutathione-specific gamma-glutamylcyclotransferase